jgi:2-polyprenyl-6-methoxyphenol hydroxylase-like FAD-dependent oxidoreductase
MGFLNVLAKHGARFATFDLRMQAEVTDLIEDNGRIAGVRVTTPTGGWAIRAALVVGADGRHSVVRERAGLPVEDVGAPIDVLWMRLSRRPSDGAEPLGRIGAGKILVMLDRGDYWQCAYVIPKGGFEEIKKQGLEAFRAAIVELAPQMSDRVLELKSWDDIKLLTVKVDRLREWHRAGLLCIGDAAHAMSPVGGVGVNLAVQDAVATANLLAAKLATGCPSGGELEAVQKRREFPVRMTQAMQVAVQNNIISVALRPGEGPLKPPLFARVINAVPWLQGLTARFIGLGVRPEHVRSPEV